MIEVKNVVKTFDGFRALDGTDITVPDGGVYGLVGPNGAGKSTVIRHLTGIYRPDSGQVLVDGEPIYENPGKKGQLAARRQQIEKAYDLALQRLLSLEEGDYCALLVKLCQETGEKQGEILLNARDKARLGETLVEQINQKIGAAFTLGQEEKNIAGGFVLRQGPVEINCALETAVHLLEEETASQVAAILF